MKPECKYCIKQNECSHVEERRCKNRKYNRFESIYPSKYKFMEMTEKEHNKLTDVLFEKRKQLDG